MGCFLSTQKTELTILILGLSDSGKTSIFNVLQNYTNRETTPTYGFDFGVISNGNYNIKICDLPGNINYRSIWKNYYSEAYGIIYVCDVTNKEAQQETEKLFFEIRNHGLVIDKPFVIYLNKFDALKESKDTSHWFTDLIDRAYSVNTITDEGRELIKKGFHHLTHQISDNFDSLQDRISLDVKEANKLNTIRNRQSDIRVEAWKEERKEKSMKLNDDNTSKNTKIETESDSSKVMEIQEKNHQIEGDEIEHLHDSTVEKVCSSTTQKINEGFADTETKDTIKQKEENSDDDYTAVNADERSSILHPHDDTSIKMHFNSQPLIVDEL